MTPTKEDIGKVATIRPICRYTTRTVTRIIKDVREDGDIIVRFMGWSDFIVKTHEIIDIN